MPISWRKMSYIIIIPPKQKPDKTRHGLKDTKPDLIHPMPSDDLLKL